MFKKSRVYLNKEIVAAMKKYNKQLYKVIENDIAVIGGYTKIVCPWCNNTFYDDPNYVIKRIPANIIVRCNANGVEYNIENSREKRTIIDNIINYHPDPFNPPLNHLVYQMTECPNCGGNIALTEDIRDSHFDTNCPGCNICGINQSREECLTTCALCGIIDDYNVDTDDVLDGLCADYDCSSFYLRSDVYNIRLFEIKEELERLKSQEIYKNV